MRRAAILAVIAFVVFPYTAVGDTIAAIKRAKSGEFDATGKVGCAQEVGQTLGSCTAKVARTDGSAAMLVTFRNGFSRTLTFSDGEFLRGDTTMSGVGTDTDWNRTGGFYQIRVDDQRFEIPEALVFGD